MATGRKSQKGKKARKHAQLSHKKVEEVEHERTEDRSWATKENLLKLKKQNLLLRIRYTMDRDYAQRTQKRC